MKKKLLFSAIVSGLIILSVFSGVNAQTNNSNRNQGSAGAGIFVHDHEGQPHTHYFAFTVSNGKIGTDDWLNNPNGRFYLLVKHEKEVHMIVNSEQITRFKVTQNGDSSSIVFEGTATVQHKDSGLETGWLLRVEATDNSPKGAGEDAIHVLLTSTKGEVHHMKGTLINGNIIIRK